VAAVIIVVGVVAVVNIAGSGGAQRCSLPAPVPSLGPQLRAIGGFDQPYDAGDPAALASVALQAASAVSPGLLGDTPARPVAVASASTTRPDALVVPLVSTPSADQPAHVAGLVSFLRDCAGRAYYSAVRDIAPAAPGAFPAVSQDVAASRLQTGAPELVYTDSPFAPLWRNPTTGETISADG